MVMLWEDAFRGEPSVPPLPVVIPIVIYHGSRPWPGKQTKDLFPKDPVLAEFLPDFRIIVYDLPRMPQETIKGDLASNLILLLFKAMKADVPISGFVSLIRQTIEHFGEDGAVKLIDQMVRYVLEVDKDITIKQIEAEVSKSTHGGDVMRSVVSRIAPEAYENGVQVGVEKGKGEGAAGLLVRQLNAKFGIISAANIKKIKSIQDVDALSALGIKFLETSSIDEFMATVDKVLEKPVN